MEISTYIMEEAERLLQSGDTSSMPMQLPSAPAFYLATAADSSIVAFAVIFSSDGVEFKIGPKKAT